MNTKLNLRFLLFSLGCIAALGVGVYLLNRWQAKRTAGIFLAKAREAEGQRDVAKAIDLYGKYLVLDPRDVDALSECGSLLADVHAYGPASERFEASLRRDPTRSDIRRKAVKADIAIGRIADARDHLENYLLKEFPADAELLELDGFCQAKAGEYLAAGRSFEAAVAHDPTRFAAYTQLVGILSTQGEDLDKDRNEWLKDLPNKLQTTLRKDKDWAVKAGDYWTDQLVAANPKDPHAYLFRGYRRLAQKNFDAAIQDAEAALKLAPDDPAELFLAANVCLARKQLDKAREYGTRAVRAAPKDPRIYDVLAKIELADNKPDEAIHWLQKGVETDAPPTMWLKLGNLQIVRGKLDEARQTARDLRTKPFPKLDADASAPSIGPALYADLLEAQIAQVQGHWADATRRFGPLGQELKAAPDLAKQAFYSLGRSYEQLADTERALKEFQQAVEMDPMWLPAREALAANLESLGRIDEALEARTTLARLKGAPAAAWVGLIRLSILQTSRLPADQRGDWGRASGLLDEFSRTAPNSAAIPLLQAELLVAKGQQADAEKLIEAQRKNNPKEVAFWVAEIDFAIRDSRWERATQLLAEAEKQLGDSLVLRLVRAKCLVLKGEKDAAEQLRKLAEKTNDFSKADQVRLWQSLASASLAVNDFAQAEQLWQRVMAELPGDLRVRLELFDMAAQARDAKLMDAALEEIDRIESSGPIWNYAKALRLIDYGGAKGPAAAPAANAAIPPTLDKQRQADLQQALDHLAQALRLRPDWPRALMLQGLVYEELRQEDSALSKYREAVKQGEKSPEVARRALRLLYNKGEYAAANDLLHQMEGQQVPFTTDLFREQSGVLYGLQDVSGALAAAEKAAKASKDYRDYLWLGQLYGVLGRRDDAEKALRQANSLDEKAPETWVALVRLYVAAGQKDSAEKALADARAKIPAAAAPLALAECLEILGKADDAGEQYALAVKQKPDDPAIVRSVAVYYIRKGELAKAAEQLVRIVGGQIQATPPEVADARGALARVRADQGGYQNLLEAVRLANENLAAAPSSAENLRLKARLLAATPEPSRRREAIAIFEKLVEDPRNAVAEDRFRLAQLYLASGDWPKTREQMLALLATQRKQPQYVAAYAQALLDHNEPDAALWVDKLEQLDPDNPRAAQLRAEVQYRAADIDGALATLAKFVKKAQADTADHWARMLAAAAELEALAARPARQGPAKTGPSPSPSAAAVALQKAEDGYRNCAADDPKRALVLVDFLARQKRWDEALKQAESAWKSADVPQIAATCELLMRQPAISPAQLERLDAILSAAIERADTEKHSRPTALLLVSGKLRDAQGKYPEAEALYREVLQKDAANVPALNELAWILALRGQKLDEALESIDRAINLAGPQPALLDTRANVELALGQPEKALADMQTVIDAQPAANRYFHLALAQRKLGRAAEAAESLKMARAMQLAPESLHPLERPAYDELARSVQ